LLEREMITFSTNLKAPYFEYLVGNLAHFIDLIVVAQRIKYVIKVRKILVTTKEL
jgi:hypothetical protein